MAESGTDFSVVICVYTEERWDDIEAAIGSVRSQEPSAREIIVVVDHNPMLEERIRREHRNVTVVPNGGQQGLSDARNSGVRPQVGPSSRSSTMTRGRKPAGWRRWRGRTPGRR